MAEHDHIVPYESARPLVGMVGSGVKQEMVLKGGHVSLVAGPHASRSALAPARRLARGALRLTARAYPRTFRLPGGDVALRFMSAADGEAALAFARALPAHDLLFLRRDITRPEAVDFWLQGIERGRIATVLAERDGQVCGYATIDRGDLSWSPHVAELRVMVSTAMRAQGLGRLLTQEAFAVALGLGIEKMVAQMTVDQKGAISVFQGMGFRPEALLRDHVKDRDGKTHDLLILSHDVARFQAQLAAYGVGEDHLIAAESNRLSKTEELRTASRESARRFFARECVPHEATLARAAACRQRRSGTRRAPQVCCYPRHPPSDLRKEQQLFLHEVVICEGQMARHGAEASATTCPATARRALSARSAPRRGEQPLAAAPWPRRALVGADAR